MGLWAYRPTGTVRATGRRSSSAFQLSKRCEGEFARPARTLPGAGALTSDGATSQDRDDERRRRRSRGERGAPMHGTARVVEVKET